MEISLKEYQRLVLLAYHDNLTGAHNRNWLNEKYHDNDEFWFAIVDINGLKKINDNYGHLAGDSLIKSVANKLMNFGDVIRFGGDEFIVVPNSQEEFNEKEFEDNRYCYGLASKSANESIENVFQKADNYLYEKKEMLRVKKLFSKSENEEANILEILNKANQENATSDPLNKITLVENTLELLGTLKEYNVEKEEDFSSESTNVTEDVQQ